jgi:hypothetical protein
MSQQEFGQIIENLAEEWLRVVARPVGADADPR